MTDNLQESNSQVLQTINESDDGWNTDITDEFQESDLLTQFSEIIQLGSRGNTETAGQVKYRLEFEEYPETAPDVVACIYNIAGMDPEKACEIFDLKNIQYSYKDANELSVDTATLNEFVAVHKISYEYYDELAQLRCNGKPNLAKHYQHEEDTSLPHYFIGCQNYKCGEKGYRYLLLSQRTNIDYLKQLFQDYSYHEDGVNNESNAIQHCYTILPFSAKQNKCRIHNHPAPPLVKTPKSILNDLKDIIYNEDILDLTAHKLLNRLLNDSQYFVFCGYKQQIEALTFARAFTILQNSNAYQQLFEELFLCIEQDTKKPIKFNHIHNQGIGCILADEHRGQALDWVQDKKQNWVLAALSPAFTKMVHHIWINTPFTTNASESAHATINTTGRNLLLVAAIQKSANFDSHQWSTAITYEKTNIQDSYRNKSSLQCTINSAKRKQKQSTKQSIKPSTTKPKKKARYNKESSSNESSITYEQKQLLNIN
ncbi:hypothetical protein C2G38_2138644 [Gigaspora rosea]|uniref:Uncharacterized protein n=1 Tax=Gigaspora rosea TaxID=44941 RepID=A0A397VT40_9GLOM|nr:hypothetical protein C2G38_2138644 [Gigaspora rosea]